MSRWPCRRHPARLGHYQPAEADERGECQSAIKTGVHNAPLARQSKERHRLTLNSTGSGTCQTSRVHARKHGFAGFDVSCASIDSLEA